MFQHLRRWLGLDKAAPAPLDRTPSAEAGKGVAGAADASRAEAASSPSPLERSDARSAETREAARAPAPGEADHRAAIASWACRLHDVDIAEIGRLDVDLVVVDNGADRHGGHVFDASAVARMCKRQGDGRKRVLCYMSIGEAESYRFYWREAWAREPHKPAWLDRENPDWDDNWRVRFWHPEWQRLIFGTPESYLDRIVAAGFDGVYLDILEAYTAYEKERPSARQDMIDFVVRLATYARRTRPDFQVIAQNGEALLDSPAYRAALSGIAKEDLYYGAAGDEKANDGKAVEAALAMLERARRDGIPVLVIEYLADGGKIRAAHEKLARLGYAPYFALPEA